MDVYMYMCVIYATIVFQRHLFAQCHVSACYNNIITWLLKTQAVSPCLNITHMHKYSYNKYTYI